MDNDRSNQKGNPPDARISELEKTLSANTNAISELKGGFAESNATLLENFQAMLDQSVSGAVKEAVEKVEGEYKAKISEKDQQNKLLLEQIQEEKAFRQEIESKLSNMVTIDDATTAYKNIYKKLSKKHDEAYNGLSNLSTEVSASQRDVKELSNLTLTRLEAMDDFLVKAETLGGRVANMMTSVYKREAKQKAKHDAEEAKRDAKIEAQIERAGQYTDEMRDASDMMASAAEVAATTKENIQVISNEFILIKAAIDKSVEEIHGMIRTTRSDLSSLYTDHLKTIDQILKDSLQTNRSMQEEFWSKINGIESKLGQKIKNISDAITGMQKIQDSAEDSSTRQVTASARLRESINDLGPMRSFQAQLNALLSSVETISDTIGLSMNMPDIEADDEEENNKDKE